MFTAKTARRTLISAALTAGLVFTAHADAAQTSKVLTPAAGPGQQIASLSSGTSAPPRVPKKLLKRASKKKPSHTTGRKPAGLQPWSPQELAPQSRIDGTQGDFENKLQWIVYYANDYYTNTFPGYTTPTFYYNAERYSWTCGTTSLNLTGNAYYCSRGNGGSHFVIWDTNWLRRLFDSTGDAAVAAIVAHELGHAWQVPNMTSKNLGYSIYRELFADCATGSFARAMTTEGHFDSGDINEVWTTLSSIGDAAGTPWDGPTAHGSGDLRAGWLRYGWDNGAQACIKAVA
jgi:predicted metalloprotease